MRRAKQVSTTLMTILLVTSLAVAFVAFGAAPAAAVHPDDAEDVTDSSNFTVTMPHAKNHYPGDQNEENGSIEYNAVGAEAFKEQGAEDGLYYDWIIVHAEYEGVDWIDYSACSTDNTEVFGIDRGNNNSGTKVDEDLVSRQKKSVFRDDGIVIEFLNWEDIANDPPYMAPEDAVVAAQGEGSNAGPCLTLTEEPGWYRITAFANATVNDNAKDEQPSDSADYIEFELGSNFIYVCECDSEQEARDKLGPPPNEGGPSTPTPTPSSGDDTPTATESGGDDTPTATATEASNDDTPTATVTEASDGDTPTATATATEASGTEGGGGNDGGSGGDNSTPTPGDGPGFGAAAALAGLLASGLLALRRRD